jgi:hypothetical protein
VASQTKSRKRSSDREAILFVSASTTWSRGWLSAYQYHGINPHIKSLLSLIPSFTFSHFIFAICVPLLYFLKIVPI